MLGLSKKWIYCIVSTSSNCKLYDIDWAVIVPGNVDFISTWIIDCFFDGQQWQYQLSHDQEWYSEDYITDIEYKALYYACKNSGNVIASVRELDKTQYPTYTRITAQQYREAMLQIN
jgi:hypothetical protein